MPTDRDTTRIVRSWLDEGATALPERVLDAVLDQVPTTPQRRSWWPSWRSSDMNTALKLATGAAAIVGAVLIGYTLMPLSGGFGGPPATAPPSPTVAPSPTPVPRLPEGALPEGTYLVDDPTYTTVPYTITVPAGWSGGGADGTITKYAETPRELGMAPFNVTHVYTDACDSEGALTEIGPTVDDLLLALADQAGSDASVPVDVTLGGYPAKRIAMTVPADLDASTCRHPDAALIQIWADPAETTFFAIPADFDSPAPAYMADVDGERVVFLVGNERQPAHSQDDIDELNAILDSVEFQP
jgi:hypothetical protein